MLSTPPATHDVHAVDDDLLGGGGDRHQARRALAVDRHAGDGDRKAGAQRGGAADGRLHALLSAAPMITSSISAGSTLARSTAARIAWAASVGEGVALNAPR